MPFMEKMEAAKNTKTQKSMMRQFLLKGEYSGRNINTHCQAAIEGALPEFWNTGVLVPPQLKHDSLLQTGDKETGMLIIYPYFS